jgi:hypothetical protein
MLTNKRSGLIWLFVNGDVVSFLIMLYSSEAGIFPQYLRLIWCVVLMIIHLSSGFWGGDIHATVHVFLG